MSTHDDATSAYTSAYVDGYDAYTSAYVDGYDDDGLQSASLHPSSGSSQKRKKGSSASVERRRRSSGKRGNHLKQGFYQHRRREQIITTLNLLGSANESTKYEKGTGTSARNGPNGHEKQKIRSCSRSTC